MGVAPIVGFNHGSGNHSQLQNVFKKSLKLILGSSLVITAVSILMARIMAMIFASQDTALMEMTTTAIRIYSVSYIFAGVNLFGSSFFTALNNGKISALISFMRTLVMQVLFVTLLPILLGINGIWLSIVLAEFCAMAITTFCLVKYKERYKYA